MPEQVNLTLSPEEAASEDLVRKAAAAAVKRSPDDFSSVRIVRRSIDARQKDIKVNLALQVFLNGEAEPVIAPFAARDVSGGREILIAGAGPAGLFAALRLIELGLRPVIIERGKDVSERKKDIARISREQIIDPDSNYCFGLGGAGTFSDGKLFTRSKKRGDNSRVLELLYHHGANRNILYEAHPHLGTDKLPAIITSIRKSITDCGGLLLSGKRIIDIIIRDGLVAGVRAFGNESFQSPYLILATGHSARDIYYMCRSGKINVGIKPFAVGVRVEHPQELIDRIQYHGKARGRFLPASSYNIVRQVDGRGVYSFCMCPGGFIVPSATSQEEVVVNGMSPSGRNSPYANSGIVVEIKPEDLSKYKGFDEMAGIEFQKDIEREAWIRGGRTQRAPAQRLTDFISGRVSETLPGASYFPGVTSSDLNEWLPEPVCRRLKEGFRLFGQAMKGFITNEAVILGVESRTSSPVRIPRDPDSGEHIKIKGLYPCGEGSGYAGGIVSSAIDGMNAAEAIHRKLVAGGS